MTGYKLEEYQSFLKSKVLIAEGSGFEPLTECATALKYHQKVACNWAIRKGRAAIFANFGMGKTVVSIQLMKWVHELTGKPVLIVCPLGVRQEFKNDGKKFFGLDFQYCRTDAEVAVASTPYILTNYERVRDDDISVLQFGGAALDEASCLRSFGSLTTQTFFEIFKNTQYRFVATATPSPNSYKELIHYAHYLGILDSGNALTRFFQRDSSQAGNLTLYPHMEEKFWLWVASWALFIKTSGKPHPLVGGVVDHGDCCRSA